MATAPKSVPKIVQAAEAAAPAPAPKKSKMKLFVLIGVVVLALGGAGAAWKFFGHSAAASAEPKKEVAKPPVFMVLDPFTVNLQPEATEQFLQVAFTVQVGDQSQVETIKLYMPQVRSRLLLLLSSKKPSEISTVEGKKKLANDIMAAMKLPFSANAPPQTVSDVFFTSFVIQ